MSCPNKSLPEYKELVSVYGEGSALAAYVLNNEQIPTVEKAATLLGNKLKTGIKYGSDITGEGKLTNIAFVVDRRGKESYQRDSRTQIEDILRNAPLLLFKRGVPSNMVQLPISIDKKIDRLPLMAYGNYDSASYNRSLGKSFEELYNSSDRDQPEFRIASGYHLASRLLQKSDNFIGRLVESIRKEKLESKFEIGIEVDSPNSIFTTSNVGIYINADRIVEEMEKYNSYEDFIAAMELVMTEEVIHLVAAQLTNRKELEKAYDELSDEEIVQFKETYSFPEGSTKEQFMHEYIRTIIQEDIFGTSTARELKRGIREIIRKALDYIIKVFRSNPTPTSKAVVDRIKEYINKEKQTDIYAQLSTPEVLNRIYKGFQNVVEPKYFYNNFVGLVAKKGASSNKVIATAMEKWISGIPEFSNIRVVLSPTYGTINFQDKTTGKYYQLSSDTKQPVDTQISSKIRRFIESIGGSISYTGQIVIDGKVVSANAVADVINRTIQVADGKEGIDTLPEEAAHIYVHWLPKDSALYRDMMAGIRTMPEYRKVLAEYRDTPLYQNADGTVDMEKIAIEAIGKVIAGHIVNKGKNQKVQKWWQRLFEWIKNLFRGKSLDAYEQAAEDILSGDTSRLNLKDIQKAQDNGRYYLQLSAEDERFYTAIERGATDEQKAVINDLIRNPQVVLTEPAHQYISTDINDPTQYTSVTTAIGTEFTGDSSLYENDREWGNDLDRVLKGIVEGRVLSDIGATPYISDAVRREIYKDMSDYISSYIQQGYIALTQVAVADRQSGIAGSIDLLLVSPGGSMKVVDLKTSWNSVRGEKYTNPINILGQGSKIRTDTRTHISKKQQHAIQVGTYTKLLQLMGYQKVQEPVTKNYLVNAQNGVVTSFTNEGEVVHPPTSMQSAIDAIVPTKVTDYNRLDELGVENVFRSKEYKEEVHKEHEQEPVPQYTPDEITAIDTKLTEIVKTLYEYRKQLNQEAVLRNKYNRVVRDEKIEELNRTIEDILHRHNEGDRTGAYMMFLEYVDRGINATVNYLGDRKNYTDPHYASRWALGQAFLRTIYTVTDVDAFIRNNKQVRDKALEVRDNIRQAQEVVAEASRTIVKEQIIRPNTARELTDEAIMEMVANWEDITDLDLKLSDIDNSRSPLLENLAKSIKIEIEKVRIKAEQDKNNIRQAGDEVIRANGGKKDPKMYDDLWQKDSKGKRTGRMISQAGMKYWEMADNIQATLTDSRGNFKEYIKNPTTEADLEYNKELWYAKLEQRRFLEGEHISYDWETDSTIVEDGKYHYYDPEFIAERNKYQVLDKGKWTDKPSMKNTKELHQFKTKYYDLVDGYWRMETVKGEPTGRVHEEPIGEYFIKQQYIKIRDVASDGTLLSDPVYNRLRKAKPGTKDAALWKFYTAYRNKLGEMIDLLPANTQVWYQKGYIPTIRSNFIQQLSREGSNKAKLVMSELKDMFTTNAYTFQHELDKMGSISQSLPIMYTAKLQDQQVLENLNKEVADHIANKKLAVTGMEKKLWKEKLRELTDLRNREQARITADEIHPDLTEGLLHFIEMANNFSIHDAIKDELAAVESVITNMTFYEDKTNLFGKVIKRKENIPGNESRTFKRLKGYLEMIYMHDDSVGKSEIEVVTRKMMKLSSGIGIAFNWLGHTNNLIMGKLNNWLNAYGDEFYNTRALTRMEKEQTRALAAMSKNVGNKFFEKDSYLKKKPSSKYEALSGRFNMVEHRDLNDPGRIELFGKLGYGTMEGGEWLVQTKVGNAILDSIILKDTAGNEVSIYDAFQFNNVTGELSIKDGYTIDGRPFTREEEHKIHNRIRETNKLIHGNYRAMDRTMMERLAYGQLLMQYHKWVYPSFRARFQKNSFNENIGGGMYLEGRWRSVVPFIKGLREGSITLNNLWKSTFTDYSKLTKEERTKWLQELWGGVLTAEEYEKMTPEQQIALMNHRRNNLKKDIADMLYICALFAMYFILKRLSSRLDDDDPVTRKMAHWLMWQADRAGTELALFTPIGVVQSYELVKNPVAALGAIGDFGQLINASVHYPFVSDKDRVLQRGPHKGETKVYKEFTDVLPVFRQYNRIMALDNITSFYIR